MPLSPLILTATIFSDAGCLTKAWVDLFNPSPTIQLELCSSSTFVEIGISNRFCLIQGNPSLDSGEGKALNVERFDQIKFSLTKCRRKFYWLYCHYFQSHTIWNHGKENGTKKKNLPKKVHTYSKVIFTTIPKHSNFGRLTLTFYSLHCILLNSNIIFFFFFRFCHESVFWFLFRMGGESEGWRLQSPHHIITSWHWCSNCIGKPQGDEAHIAKRVICKAWGRLPCSSRGEVLFCGCSNHYYVLKWSCSDCIWKLLQVNWR